MNKEEGIILELMNKGLVQLPLEGESESERKRRVFKAACIQWWEEWGPIIWKNLKTIGKIAVVVIIGYILLWLAVIAIGLMLVASGSSSSDEYVKQQERDRQQRQKREKEDFDNYVRAKEMRRLDEEHRQRKKTRYRR